MLKSLREKLQMSKKEFAPLMGLQPAEVGRMEKPGQKLTRIQKTLIRAIDLMFDKSVDGQGVVMLRDHLDKCNREEDQATTPIQIHIIDEMKGNPAVWPDRIMLSVITVDSIIPNYIRVIVTFISNDPEEYLIGRKGGIMQIRKRMDFKGTYNLPLKKWW
jgi:hypothetical protein